VDTPSVRPAVTTARVTLGRDLIVETAAAQIDRYGVHGLSMRSVSRQLGVEAISLYRYVQGRQDLLEAVITMRLAELRDRLAGEMGQGWRNYLQALATGARRIAIEHPQTWRLLVTRRPAAPWLRPPLSSLGLVEDLLTTLTGHGFSDEQVVDTYRALSSFLLGTLFVVAEEGTPGSATVIDRPLEPTRPSIERMRPLLRKEQTAEEFGKSLQALFDRVPDLTDHHCDNPSSSRSSSDSRPASNSARL
jgi:TetR/AcrR family tetracycline transcriptional repressor